MGYICLLQNTRYAFFRIVKTNNLNRRIKQWVKKYELIAACKVENADRTRDIASKFFKTVCVGRYQDCFEGPRQKVISNFYALVSTDPPSEDIPEDYSLASLPELFIQQIRDRQHHVNIQWLQTGIVKRGDLYNAYLTWCDKNDYRPDTFTDFDSDISTSVKRVRYPIDGLNSGLKALVYDFN